MLRFVVPAAFLILAACGTDEEACVEGEFSCDGQILSLCTDGVQVEEANCDDEGGTCDADMGHCHMDGDDMDDMDGM